MTEIVAEHEKAYHSYKQYSSLVLANLHQKQQQSQALFYEANEGILADNELLAKQNFSKLEQNYQKLANRKQFLLLSTIALFIVVLVGVMQRLIRWRHKQKQQQDEINRQRYYDPLTGSYNRRYFDEHIIPTMLNHSLENSGSLLMLDIDHFKRVNDTFGHPVGDEVLKEIVARLQKDSRFTDKVVRTGGEEFLIVLSPQQRIRAKSAVARILKLISDTPMIIGDKPEKITVSIGFISLANLINKQSVLEMLSLTDKALYLAKSRGRNRAIGIESLKCSYDAIDNITTAEKNKLLKLQEIVNN